MKRLLLLIAIVCFTAVAVDSPAPSDNAEQENVFPEKKVVTYKEIIKELRKKKPKTEKFIGRFLEVSFKAKELNRVDSNLQSYARYCSVKFSEDSCSFCFFRPASDIDKFKNATKSERVGGYICRIFEYDSGYYNVFFTDDPELYKVFRDRDKAKPEPEKNFKR